MPQFSVLSRVPLLLLLSLTLVVSLVPLRVGAQEIELDRSKTLNLENISKKMSLWPKEVEAIKQITYRQNGVAKVIPAGEMLPVISIQPSGVEIEHKGSRIVLPQEAVDLHTPLTAKIREIAAEAEKQRQDYLAQQNPGQAQGAQPAQSAPPSASPQQAPGQREPGRPGRPKPRVQSTEPTEFIRALDQNLLISGNNRLRQYSSLQFKDKHYYLILMGASWDEGSVKLVELLKPFYTRAQQYNSNFEIVYVSFDRQEKDAKEYLMEAKMPWPAIDPGEVRKHREIVPLEAPGIPALALVDRQGNVISHSHGEDRQTYRGPQEVIADLISVLNLP